MTATILPEFTVKTKVAIKTPLYRGVYKTHRPKARAPFLFMSRHMHSSRTDNKVYVKPNTLNLSSVSHT